MVRHGILVWCLRIAAVIAPTFLAVSASAEPPKEISLLRALFGPEAQELTGQIESDAKPSRADSGEGFVEVTDEGRVEMHVADMPLSTVLRMLSLQGRRNIIASPGVSGTVTANLYEVTFEEALDAILMSNRAGYRVKDAFIYVYTLEELAQMEVDKNPATSRVFILNYVTAAELQAMIVPMLSEKGSVSVSAPSQIGVATDPENAGGNALASRDFLVIHDRADRLDEIARVIAEIDVRPKQVLVEATLLRAQLTEDNALGIDFTVTGGVDLELLGSTSVGITNLTLGELPTERLEQFNSNLTTDFAGNVPEGGVTFGIIKDHVATFIRALESVVDTTVIANPKILALNKQKGEVIVGREDGYPVITVTETASVQSTALVKTGTRLLFRPYIADDGWVRMELHPEDSVGGVAGDQPFKETTEVTTNIMVRDGQTILIGGLFRDATTGRRSQVPLLGDIPGLGAAFRSRADTVDREEVIILLTVHIVKDPDAFAQAGAEQMNNLEKIRVGARRGTQWHGRERMAQAYYRQALEDYSKGDLDMALWNVRLAIHHNSRFLPAIDLKETLLHEREWDTDGTSARSFIHDLIAAEHPELEPLPLEEVEPMLQAVAPASESGNE